MLDVKKKLYSLSRVPKQVHLSLMGEGRREHANAEKHMSLQEEACCGGNGCAHIL